MFTDSFPNPFGFGAANVANGPEALRALAARKKAENLQKAADQVEALKNTTIDGVTSGLSATGAVVENARQSAAANAKAALSSNIWVATAQDDVAVKDAYDVNTGSPITAVQNLMDAADLSFSDVMRGGKWVASQVPLAFSLLRRGQTILSAKGLAARIIGASSLSNALISKLSPGAMGGILDMVSDNKQLFASVSGVVSRVASTNLSDIRAVGGLLYSVTGDKNLFSVDDQDSTVGLYAGIIREATSLGIPGSWDALTHQITNTNLLGQIANKTLPNMLQKADALGLSQMAESLGDKGVLALRPNALSDFGAYFTLPELSTSKDVSTLFSDVSGCFRKVNSEWDTAKRGTDTVLNLTSLMSMSNDLRGVFTQGAMQSSDPSTKLFALANVFSKQSVTDSLSRAFPKTVIQPNAMLNENAVDADLVKSAPSLQDLKSVQFLDATVSEGDTLAVVKPGYKPNHTGFGLGALEDTTIDGVSSGRGANGIVVETIAPKGGYASSSILQDMNQRVLGYPAKYASFKTPAEMKTWEMQEFGFVLTPQARQRYL